jgi:hypothetical protein
MAGSLLQTADYVIQTIKDQGIALSLSSRLQVMRMSFLRPDGTPKIVSPDDPHANIAREGIRDFQILEFALRHLLDIQPPLGQPLMERLRKIVGDKPLPQDQNDRTHGRDAQAECYVAAVCTKAGMQPRLGEPDIICGLDGQQWALEVKRIKKIARFQERVKEAIDQIQRVKLPGIVVCDLTVMLNEKNEAIFAPIRDKEFLSLWRASFSRFIRDYGPRLDSWRHGTEVRGMIFLQHYIRLNPETGWELNTLTNCLNQSHFNQQRDREFLRFAERF